MSKYGTLTNELFLLIPDNSFPVLIPLGELGFEKLKEGQGKKGNSSVSDSFVFPLWVGEEAIIAAKSTQSTWGGRSNCLPLVNVIQ